MSNSYSNRKVLETFLSLPSISIFRESVDVTNSETGDIVQRFDVYVAFDERQYNKTTKQFYTINHKVRLGVDEANATIDAIKKLLHK